MSINSDYSVLNLSGDNYIEWTMNTSGRLKLRGVWKCTKWDNDTPACERSYALKITKDKLCDDLKMMYSYINDPHYLWYTLNNRYSEMFLHKAEKEWREIKFQNYESVNKYDSDLMRIAYTLNLFGESTTNRDKLTKTRETIHPSDAISLYHASKCTTYFDLLDKLLEIEKKKKTKAENIKQFDEILSIHKLRQEFDLSIPEAGEEQTEWTHVDNELDLFIE